MTRIEVESLTKQFGPVTAVEDISFDVQGEEFLSIVGPSGCGKTTTLRCIAGLESPSGGRILYDGADVTDVPVNKRNIAMMFQSIALYPHMTLRNNIGYPLKVSGVPRAEMNEEVEEAASVMQIDEDLDKYPGELSGGQQQRVALARTVVGDSVALLMDEPLSDLDAKLKVEIRKEIQRIHRRIGEPAIYVTHDQEEAMTMSDRIVVMNEGRIEQIGDVDEVYQFPTNRFVAEFIGNPSMNFVSGSLSALGDGSATVETEGNEITFDAERLVERYDGDAVTVGVRPQNVDLVGDGTRALSGTIRLLEPIGDRTLATIDGPQGELSALIPRNTGVAEEAETEIYVDSSELYLFDPDSTKLIARSKTVSSG